jgi:hypothetical protein
MASDIPHPEVFVHNFLQVIDIILLIGQNKNTLSLTCTHLVVLIKK